ncbi:MAG: glycosyltransferase family 9 protein, partial [Rhodospirillales bacterium]|nr:glycosyltransferase family 9 protein [Rhodospirillales bacterium]
CFPLIRALEGPTTIISHYAHGSLAAALLPAVHEMDADLLEFTRLHVDGGPSAVSPAVREMFEQATAIFSFISTGEDAWATNVKKLAPNAAVFVLATRPPEDFVGHVTDWHREQLKVQGLEYKPVMTALLDDGQLKDNGPVMVHPGSGGKAKCWPAERFEALIAALRDEGREVTAVLGHVERELWNDEQVARWEEKYGATTPGSLVELAERMKQASVYVGNDAGPTHLAAQLGLRTIALFGPTEPMTWKPPGPRVEVVAPDKPKGMEWLEVEKILPIIK